MSSDFDKFIDILNKNKNKNAGTTFAGTDLRLSSHVPYGIPTRIPQLDLSLGRPGYPAGRIVELFGFESTGKSTAGLHAIAEVQRLGGMAQLIDVENCWDPIRAAECGVDPDRVMVTQVDCLEGVYIEIEAVLDSLEESGFDKPFLSVVDTVSATSTASEMGKDLADTAKVGSEAVVSRRALKKLNHRIADRNVNIVMVNHAVAKIGAMWGEKSMSAGGHAIKFWSSVRVEFGFIGNIAEGKTADDKIRTGQTVQIRTKKNKVAHTGQPSFQIPLTENGFDLDYSLLEAFKQIGAVEQVNKQSFHFKPTDATMKNGQWPAYVEERGGSIHMYDWFLQEAPKVINPKTDRPFLRPYGVEVIEE